MSSGFYRLLGTKYAITLLCYSNTEQRNLIVCFDECLFLTNDSGSRKINFNLNIDNDVGT